MGKKSEPKKQYRQLKEKYMQLQEDYDNACDYLRLYSQHVRRQDELIRYQHDYIHWKSLDEEFALFQKYAHGEDSDTDFPYLVM